MIGIILRLAGDIVKVVVDGNNVSFYDTATNMLTTIEGLQFNKAGIIKEFPDLADDLDFKLKAIERFKEHIKSFKTEDEKIEYIKTELTKFGYTPLLKERKGFRPVRYAQ
jgi:hypothetical protein